MCGGEVEQDIAQNLGQLAGGHRVGIHTHPDRGGAALQVGVDGLAGLGRVGFLNELSTEPALIHLSRADRGATREWGHSGETKLLDAIVNGVQRLDHKPIDGVARQTLVCLLNVEFLALGTLPVQYLQHLFLPVGKAGSGEVGGETDLGRAR